MKHYQIYKLAKLNTVADLQHAAASIRNNPVENSRRGYRWNYQTQMYHGAKLKLARIEAKIERLNSAPKENQDMKNTTHLGPEDEIVQAPKAVHISMSPEEALAIHLAIDAYWDCVIDDDPTLKKIYRDTLKALESVRKKLTAKQRTNTTENPDMKKIKHYPFHNNGNNPSTCELWKEHVGGRNATCPCESECQTCAAPLVRPEVGEDFYDECATCRMAGALQRKMLQMETALKEVVQYAKDTDGIKGLRASAEAALTAHGEDSPN